MTRPTGVTVVGWAAIWLGSLGVFAAAMGLFIASSIRGPLPRPGADEPMEFVFGFVFQHFAAVAAGQAVVSAVVVAAGASLLRLRRWAARVLEVVAWLVLSYAVAFTAYFMHEVSEKGQAHAATSEQRSAQVILFVVPAITLAFYGLPLVAAIRTLRSRETKDVLA